ncbi:hypothetical protein HO173_001482 [Letharia columbiana]|uniref:Uncharacterized protein n=1 Tax=Letharia columbiana TaxID=112416 RepID=A0A8H6G559_9LECA|nr:uncharacterized protein HO173_001482 [Letharia columbiana]KAF6240809.1 hypothetical protein HO173_001482 [Letharia columbiana]
MTISRQTWYHLRNPERTQCNCLKPPLSAKIRQGSDVSARNTLKATLLHIVLSYPHVPGLSQAEEANHMIVVEGGTERTGKAETKYFGGNRGAA